MNSAIVARELVKAARDITGAGGGGPQWQDILKISKRTGKHGDKEMVEFMAEVWNGGLEQWVQNGHADEIHAVIGVTRLMGNVGHSAADKLSELKQTIEEYDEAYDAQSEDYDEETISELGDELDQFDDWFYKNDGRFQQEFYEYLTKGAGIAASE